MYLTELKEKQLQYLYCMFLILFNLVSLYFIMDLLSYDEIIGYLSDGGIKTDCPRRLAYLFFINGVSNLFFVCVSLMARLFDK
ncbi:hypothetical protein FLACHUCJ7_02028 [Flavobacterium chungangense]|uniref:Uncharacterized protein n=1 Tax=Flavobacterium chungangense TaxID=554283 RepID=A0A6V6YZ82_9FLAO|nr:hypothetical protein FLACHUCJ7_02028 [Flavobacterium chungangense]